MSERKSTHKVEVVPLILEKHPGADLLSVAKIGDWECVTQTAQWDGKDRAAYILPDTLCPVSRPEFSFLAKDADADGYVRIRARRFRGVKSFGLLVPAPDGSAVGDDVADILGCKHYDPPVKQATQSIEIDPTTKKRVAVNVAEGMKGPDVPAPEYDLEPGKKFGQNAFEEGEPTLIFEKLHGASSVYVYTNGEMFCGSKSGFKREYPDTSHITREFLLERGATEERAAEIVARLAESKRNSGWWWSAYDDNPCIGEFCRANPDYVLYGEIVGNKIQGGFPYGVPQGKIGFFAFDIMKDGAYLNNGDARELASRHNVPWVPFLGEIPYNGEVIKEMAEGNTTVPGANHIREGVVVGPLTERWHPKAGRVKLKWVGLGYSEKKGT